MRLKYICNFGQEEEEKWEEEKCEENRVIFRNKYLKNY